MVASKRSIATRKKTIAKEMKTQCRSRQDLDIQRAFISGDLWNHVKNEATRANKLERKS
jgi:hypothetical protein